MEYKTIDNLRSVYLTPSYNKLYSMQTNRGGGNKHYWLLPGQQEGFIYSPSFFAKSFLNVVSFTRRPHNFHRSKDAKLVIISMVLGKSRGYKPNTYYIIIFSTVKMNSSFC